MRKLMTLGSIGAVLAVLVAAPVRAAVVEK